MRDRAAVDLFLISWLVLFLELACIRWFPSHVLFLTFFVNLVLLACFVGMSIGCLVARCPTNYIRHTPYWLLLGISAGLLMSAYSNEFLTVFAVGNQANPDVVYFGSESSITLKATNPLGFVIPIEVVGGLFFALIVAILVGPGQEMGRAFNRVENPTRAYSANLLGSLIGIGMFALCSYLRLPPVVWFALVAVVLVYLYGRHDIFHHARPHPMPVVGVVPVAPGDAPAPRRPLPAAELALLATLGLVVALTAFTSGFSTIRGKTITWSEYYRIDYDAPNRFINTNLISQQLMEPRENPPIANVPYALPYLFQRDVKKPDGTPAWPKFKRILIIGAGNGNDVARALLWADPDTEIDAVEIDPVIQKLGEMHHPNQPFKDRRVRAYINDGRNFLRTAPDGTYDLVVFALIDSLVLQSGYSNLRLESYLFTLESFKDVKRVLKPTGVYAVYNFFRQGWIGARIRDQLTQAFNTEPVAIVTPPLGSPNVKLDQFEPGACTGFFGGSEDVLEPLRAAFQPRDGRPVKYYYPWNTGVMKETRAGFYTDVEAAQMPPPPQVGVPLRRLRYTEDDQPVIDAATGHHVSDPIPPEWMALEPSVIEPSKDKLRMATDNWPFLYTREPNIPGVTWRGVLIVLLLSIGLWSLFGGRQALASEAGAKPEYGLMIRSFFLGAGFMLVETKAVVEMALLFGGTWMVNTAVFAAILIMSLAGNLYAGRVRPKRLEPYYAGLFVCLGVGLLISPSAFLGAGPVVQVLGACLLVFAPIAFAGVVFATTFRRTTQPDRVIGANVAGALIGGLAENTSVVLGFQLLLCVAVGFYVLSALYSGREVPGGAPPSDV